MSSKMVNPHLDLKEKVGSSTFLYVILDVKQSLMTSAKLIEHQSYQSL